MIILQTITYVIVTQNSQIIASSILYWSIHITLVNGLLLFMMVFLFKRNGRCYFSLFSRFNKENTVYFLKILGPLVMLAVLPNIFLSMLLYQDPQIGATFLLGEMSLVFLLFNLTFFPVLQGIVELPYYFSFIMPTVEKLTNIFLKHSTCVYASSVSWGLSCV